MKFSTAILAISSLAAFGVALAQDEGSQLPPVEAPTTPPVEAPPIRGAAACAAGRNRAAPAGRNADGRGGDAAAARKSSCRRPRQAQRPSPSASFSAASTRSPRALRRFEVNLKQQVFYNTLIVTAQACKTRPPEEPPESAAFLEIQERKSDGTTQKIFSGWMFAS